jgi:hypothetical protein
MKESRRLALPRTPCSVIHDDFVVDTDFAKRWQRPILPIRQGNTANHSSVLEHIWLLEWNPFIQASGIKYKLKHSLQNHLYTNIYYTFWMFSVDIEVHCPSSERKETYKEPPKTDYIRATTNKNASRVDSLCMLIASFCLTSTHAIRKRAALPKCETSPSLFYPTTLFSSTLPQ